MDSKYSKRQEQALIHWYLNLITVMTMDWDEWSGKTIADRWTEIRAGVKGIPHITSDYCAYCQECHCAECPLYQDGTACCIEWENVRDALIRNSDRDKAIEAIEALICHIQEAR
jgi:hypothetical protein